MQVSFGVSSLVLINCTFALSLIRLAKEPTFCLTVISSICLFSICLIYPCPTFFGFTLLFFFLTTCIGWLAHFLLEFSVFPNKYILGYVVFMNYCFNCISQVLVCNSLSFRSKYFLIV